MGKSAQPTQLGWSTFPPPMGTSSSWMALGFRLLFLAVLGGTASGSWLTAPFSEQAYDAAAHEERPLAHRPAPRPTMCAHGECQLLAAGQPHCFTVGLFYLLGSDGVTCSRVTATPAPSTASTAAAPPARKCAPGRYKLLHRGGKAGAGTSDGFTTVDACADCPHGKFQSRQGGLICNACDTMPPLWSVTNTARTACEPGIPPCARGRYFVSVVQRELPIDLFGCTACPAGRYQDQRSQTECKACTAPMRKTDAKRERCDDQCPPGTYHERGAVAGCRRCAANAYQKGFGARWCKQCLPVMGTVNRARTRCIAPTSSAPATAAPQLGAVAVQVAAGQRCGYTRGTLRYRCDEGLVCARIGLHSYLCKRPGALKTRCARGRYVSVLARGGCAACAAGFFQPDSATTTTTCVRCAAGRFSSPAAGACAFTLGTMPPTTATPTRARTNARCKPGTYRLDPTLPCTGCPRHYYQPRAGQSVCFKCPNSAASSADRRTCLGGTNKPGSCGIGQALRVSQGGACAPCAAGRYMPFASHSSQHCYACRPGCSSEEGAKQCRCMHKAQDCKMSPWSGWAPCEGGMQVRTSIMLQPPRYGGEPCGGSAQTRACKSRNSSTSSASRLDVPTAVHKCKPGTYRDRGSAHCIVCHAGYFQDLPDQRSCNACQAGKISSGDRTSCITPPAPASPAPDTAPSPTHCALLAAPANGRVLLAVQTSSGWAKKGTHATISCVWPYTLSGLATRVCDGAAWTGTPGMCIAPDAGMKDVDACKVGVCCPLLPEPQNGVLAQSRRSVGAQVVLKCAVGFKQAGPARRECLHDLKWSDTISFCYRGVPTPAPHHYDKCKAGTFRERGGHVCKPCKAGTVQPGQNKRWCNACQVGMTNDATRTKCVFGTVVRECAPPVQPDHGSVITVKGPLVPGSLATFSCDEGYTLRGTAGQTCNLHLQWNGLQPECIAATTGAPKPVNCEVSMWSAWGPCQVPTLDRSSTQCNKEGVQMRERLVLAPASFGGTGCPALSQTQSCSIFCKDVPTEEPERRPSVGVSTNQGGVQHVSFGSGKVAPTLPPPTVAPTAFVCKPGQYHLRGVNECAPCPAGMYQPKSGQRFCERCPADRPVAQLPWRVSCTKLCPSGHAWVPALGACGKCAPGTVAPAAGALCERCVVGRHSNAAHTACHKDLCTAGTFHARDSQSCKPCQAGTFQDNAGQKSCKSCPPSTVTSRSRTSCLRTLAGRKTRTSTVVAAPPTVTTTALALTTAAPAPTTTAAPTTTLAPIITAMSTTVAPTTTNIETVAPSVMPTVAAERTPWWQASQQQVTTGTEVCQTVQRVYSMDQQLYVLVDPLLTDLRITAAVERIYSDNGSGAHLLAAFGSNEAILRAISKHGWGAAPTTRGAATRRIAFGATSSGPSWIGASSVCMAPSANRWPLSAFSTCQSIKKRSHDSDGNLLLETHQNAGAHAVLITADDAATFDGATSLCFRSSRALACPTGRKCISQGPTPAPVTSSTTRLSLVNTMVDGGPVSDDVQELHSDASCDCPSSLFGVVGSVSLCAAMCRGVPECNLFQFGTGPARGKCYMLHSRGGQHTVCPEGWVRDTFRTFELSLHTPVPASTPAPSAQPTTTVQCPHGLVLHTTSPGLVNCVRPWYAKVSDPKAASVHSHQEQEEGGARGGRLPNPTKIWSPADPDRKMWWQG